MLETLFGIGAYNFKEKGVIKWKKFGKMSQDMNGLYEVSSLGRVKFLNYNHTKKEKITNGSINHRGYYRVSLSKKGKVKYYPVNRLVAETFLDKTNFKYWYTEDPKEINVNNLVVNHKDENPANNSINNLEWCTPMYNNYYSRLKHTKSIQCIETGIVYSNKHSASAHTGIHPVCIISACAGRQKNSWWLSLEIRVTLARVGLCIAQNKCSYMCVACV